jgi:hypothetical protein
MDVVCIAYQNAIYRRYEKIGAIFSRLVQHDKHLKYINLYLQHRDEAKIDRKDWSKEMYCIG